MYEDIAANLYNAGLVRAEVRGCDRERKNCGGWWVSDFDTWEKCPVCYCGQEHPEARMDREAEEERWANLTPEARAAEEAELARWQAEREREAAEAEAKGTEYIPF